MTRTPSESVTPQKFKAAWAQAPTALKVVFWLVIAVGAWLIIGPTLLFLKVRSLLTTGGNLVEATGGVSVFGFGANAGSAKQWLDVLNWAIDTMGATFSTILLVAMVAGALLFVCYIVLARNLIKGRRDSRITYSILAGITIIGFALGALESLWSIIALAALVILWLPPANRAFALPQHILDARKAARAERMAGAKSKAGRAVADTGESAVQAAKDAATNVGQTVSATAQVVANHAVPAAKERLDDGAQTLKAVGAVAKQRLEQNETAYVVGGLAKRLAQRAAGAAATKVEETKRQVRGHAATGTSALEPGQAVFGESDAGGAPKPAAPREVGPGGAD